MNTAQAPWLPAKLVPFFTLSYPTAPPLHPDSFLESNYYGTGLLDGWLIITAIAIMAVLRDVTRVFLMEPFARWKLRRDLQSRKRKKLALANGNGNGAAKSNGHVHHPRLRSFRVQTRPAASVTDPCVLATQNKVLYASLAESDPEVQNIIDKETWRQWSGLELIASEVSPDFILVFVLLTGTIELDLSRNYGSERIHSYEQVL